MLKLPLRDYWPNFKKKINMELSTLFEQAVANSKTLPENPAMMFCCKCMRCISSQQKAM